MKMSLLLFCGLAFSSAHASNFYRTDNSLKDPLSEAHAAFVVGNSLKVSTAIRDTLFAYPHDQVVQQNALQLYKQASLQAGVQGLPTDWKLPEEITKMKINTRHIQGERTKYQFMVSGDIVQQGLIQQLKVVKYPDQVIVDKENGIGRFKEEFSKEKGANYSLYNDKTNKPTASGLYLLKVVLKSGKAVDGWFIIEDDMTSTRTPQVQTPTMDQVFTTGRPTFHWKNFFSPEYKADEVRGLWLGIYRTDLGDEWVRSWGKWLRAPSIEELTVGTTEPDNGVDDLVNGAYSFEVSYSEARNFGDLTLVRGSTVLRPFKIQKN